MENSMDSSSRSCSAESFNELKQMLMRTTLELESSRVAADAQKQMFDAKVKHLEGLLKTTQSERDDALHRCMELQNGLSRTSSSLASIFSDTSERSSSDWLSFELEQMNQQQQSENNSNSNNVVASAQPWHFGNDGMVSDFHMAAASTGFQAPSHGTGTMRSCTVATVSGYLGNEHIGEAYPSILLQDTRAGHLLEPPELPAAPTTEADMNVLIQKSLPERGRMLEAVMQAGPLLHTLLLAGPLPQWHHPPPAHFQIPVIPSVSMPTGSLEQHHQASMCDFASMGGSGFVSSVSSAKSEPVGFLHRPQAAAATVLPASMAGFVTSSAAASKPVRLLHRQQAAVVGAGLPARISSSREEHLGHPPQHSMQQQQDAKHHLRPLIKCAKAC